MPRYYIKPFTIFLLLLTACFNQQHPNNWIDINYAGDDKKYHRMDIHLPDNDDSLFPVVVIIYGCGWMCNNMKQDAFNIIGYPLLASGFAVVSVNHRSCTDTVFPAQIHDIKAAVRFLHANAEKYKIDTSFVGITGFSSGGHLAALAGTSGNIERFTVGSTTYNLEGCVGEFLSFSSSVDAVVDWFGPSDLTGDDTCDSKFINTLESLVSCLIGGSVTANQDKCALASPLTYVDPHDPPFLIFHGTVDEIVPYCQSEVLYNALRGNNIPVEYVLVQGAKHGQGLIEEKYLQMMTDFFIGEWNK